MEILLEQRFRCATIVLYKNYCKLQDFQKYKYDSSYSDPFSVQSIDLLKPFSRKNQQYFIEMDSHLAPSTYQYPKFEVVKEHMTMSDTQIKRHYNNPFARVKINIYERSIKKRGDKIIINNTEFHKERQPNFKYFNSITNRTIFTFDFRTGNFQIIHTTSRGKKKGTKVFRTNNFNYLKEALRNSPGIFRLNRLNENKKYKNESQELINDNEFNNIIAKIFGIDAFALNKMDSYGGFYNKIMELFVKIRKIKIPNHSYEHLLEYNYPKEILLKKNGRKLVASVLDLYGIKSKYTIKLLHNYPYLNLISITKLCLLFGQHYQKYLSSINESLFAKSQTQEREVRAFFSITDYKVQIYNFKIGDIEKENIVRILNDNQFQKPITEEVISDIYDHFNMIDKIRVYDNKISMKAKTYLEFVNEHRELSKTVSAIKKGWVIEYVYDDKTIEQIEEPISINIGTDIDDTTIFIPHILKREEEYIEEGKFMHHCVASYADHERSMIVSIRNPNGLDRVTCEFEIQSGRLIQARHFCNATPPEDYNDVIEDVKDKVRLLARYGTLNWKEKRKAPVLINGKEVKHDTPTQMDDFFNLF
jgi:hypothetical protein